ncbi:hypothetical protein QJS04_geneDACA011958 [Acorus gramineus]|uniref:Pesticidal crystal cry8Ba protein n=1 Tax=Acorus gramineus TaxID=55184 RepID=A0AAV9AGW2_ACOGR|nr:hypothetical protein QJS04_geneDACA011958 [Acorus gramineus]
MFNEGLDPNALRWAREGPRQRLDKYGLPPTNKFRSGHLPAAAHVVPRVIPDESESEFGSDAEGSTDSEEGVRYSPDSSSPVVVGSGRYSAPQRRIPRYRCSSEYSCSYSDLSSSRENGYGFKLQAAPRTVRYPVGESEYSEEIDEEGSSDSGVSSGLGGRGVNGRGLGSRGSYTVESYDSNAPPSRASRVDVEVVHKKDCRITKDSVPSAPPFHGLRQEINHGVDRVPASATCDIPQATISNCNTVKKEPNTHVNVGSKQASQYPRSASFGVKAVPSSGSQPPVRIPAFHASGQGPWTAFIAYDACVRLCLHSWAKGCMEAPIFLENECALLRSAFGLQLILLQSEDELLTKRSAEIVGEGAAPKPKKIIGKMKVQIRKVRMSPDMPSGCTFQSLGTSMVNLQSFKSRMSNIQSTLSTGCEALRKVRVTPRIPANSSFSRHSLAYAHAGNEMLKQAYGLFKVGVTNLRNSSSYETVQETYSCTLRLKSSLEEDAVRMQPGSGETHVFFPDSLGDDLIVEIRDSKGKSLGRALAQVATIAEVPGEKVRWWSIYREPEHELVGRLQLFISYMTGLDENNSLKCGSVAETVAYDLVLEVAMKVQHFKQRNLLLHGSWKWLLAEFASYYGVSDEYTRLRYLSYVMDVATPTEDCLVIVDDLLSPVLLKRHSGTLSHQENRILGEVEEQIKQILSLVFENYKSLDESSPSGMMDVFGPASGLPAPALVPSLKLYTKLNDIFSPEAQSKLCSYFQAAAKKRSRRHMLEIDEFIASSAEGTLLDPVSQSTAYQKMKAVCLNIRNEIYTDIEIHNQNVLPSSIDLPNIAASIYSAELCSRLRAFLVACPPTGPSPPVAELVIATADFQSDLENWKISPVVGGVDAKGLFHLYIMLWIEDKRLSLLESCRLDKVKWSGVRTPHSTTPFVDEMYERLKDTLTEYEVITCRWPDYTFVLEDAVADVEKAVVEALEKQYADVLAPLKDNLMPKKFGLKYVQKLAKRNSALPYAVPDELGILLNTMKRLLDVLRPKIEMQIKSWGFCIPQRGSAVAGERLSEVTVMLRAKFRNYVQAVVEKLAENTRLQSATKLKKIIQDSKDSVIESDIQNRMQHLKNMLSKTIDHLHLVFESHVFVTICRGFWDRMGQVCLSVLPQVVFYQIQVMIDI